MLSILSKTTSSPFLDKHTSYNSFRLSTRCLTGVGMCVLQKGTPATCSNTQLQNFTQFSWKVMNMPPSFICSLLAQDFHLCGIELVRHSVFSGNGLKAITSHLLALLLQLIKAENSSTCLTANQSHS